MGFATHDLLRQGGYEEGDTLTFSGAQVYPRSKFSVSSSSFTFNGSVTGQSLVDLSDVPQSATLKARMVFKTWTPMDADGDFKGVFNDLPGTVETPVETVESGKTFNESRTDTVEIDARDVSQFRPEVRSDGTNTVTMVNAYPSFVVEL